MKLITGRFYWFRHKRLTNWRLCYVQGDEQGRQWLLQTGNLKSELWLMDTDSFEFQEVGASIMVSWAA